MEKKDYYDITEVCRMFGTTSRTLRFYEEKGVIQSTRFSSRRCYTQHQIDNIRNVLVLRTLGVSVKSILELLSENADLKQILLLKRAQIEALIDTKQRELTLLNSALNMIGDDQSIFECEIKPRATVDNPRIIEIINKCNESVIGGNPQNLYNYLNDTMKKYMPISVFEKVRADTLKPLGNFLSLDKLEYSRKYPHIVYQYVKYEKLGLKIKYVFYGEKIEGFWMGYYEVNK